MSDIKLFRLQSGKATELQGDASDLERPLQTLIEANLDTLLGIRFLATEYFTGKTHAGRIDSLGLDENNCPVIPSHLSELVASLEGHVMSLGDDVQRKELKLYVAFKRLKNFATVVPQKNRLLLYLHLDPAKALPMPPNGQDVSQKGH